MTGFESFRRFGAKANEQDTYQQPRRRRNRRGATAILAVGLFAVLAACGGSSSGRLAAHYIADGKQHNEHRQH